MSDPDRRPLCVCRIENPPHMADGVDEWMPQHFDDSLDHDAVTAVASYRVLQDFSPEGGLPWLFNGHGNRFIVYVADDVPGLLAWMDSPILRDAIDDGVDRESAFPALDGEPFTGNIYEVSEVRGAAGADFAGRCAIFVERFEVGDADAAEFDAWLDGPHLDAVASFPGVLRTRTFRGNRSAPDEFPFNRYRSKGNRMIWAELPADTDLRQLVRDPAVRAAVEDSLRWDLRLPYVRRELAVNHVLRDKDDARSTYDTRRAARSA